MGRGAMGVAAIRKLGMKGARNGHGKPWTGGDCPRREECSRRQGAGQRVFSGNPRKARYTPALTTDWMPCARDAYRPAAEVIGHASGTPGGSESWGKPGENVRLGKKWRETERSHRERQARIHATDVRAALSPVQGLGQVPQGLRPPRHGRVKRVRVVFRPAHALRQQRAVVVDHRARRLPQPRCPPRPRPSRRGSWSLRADAFDRHAVWPEVLRWPEVINTAQP